jgi:hypothetical protein
MKKYFNYKSLIIVLIVGLIANNILLQIKVEEAIDAASDAEYEARRAFDEAKKANNNSFGNQCFSCP